MDISAGPLGFLRRFPRACSVDQESDGGVGVNRHFGDWHSLENLRLLGSNVLLHMGRN